MKPGDWGIMDNLAFHEVLGIRSATESVVPPCSPDFNPIEMAFAKLNALLRKAAQRTVEGWGILSAS